MHRRRYLALVTSGLAGAAGCLGRPPGGTDSPTAPEPGGGEPTATPPGTTESPSTTLDLGEPYERPDGRSVTLSNARVRLIALRAGTHLDPVSVDGGQYVVVDVAAAGDANGTGESGVLPDPAEFDVTLDGVDATPDDRGFWTGYPGTSAEDGGTMATPVTTAAADEAAIHWRGTDESVAWRLTAAHRWAIARAPAFEVRRFDVPETVEHGASFDASLTVANVGERDGRFLAELGATAISDTPEFEFDVPAGESVDHVEPVDPFYPTDAGELRVVLDWGVDRLVRRVAVK